MVIMATLITVMIMILSLNDTRENDSNGNDNYKVFTNLTGNGLCHTRTTSDNSIILLIK